MHDVWRSARFLKTAYSTQHFYNNHTSTHTIKHLKLINLESPTPSHSAPVPKSRIRVHVITQSVSPFETHSRQLYGSELEDGRVETKRIRSVCGFDLGTGKPVFDMFSEMQEKRRLLRSVRNLGEVQQFIYVCRNDAESICGPIKVKLRLALIACGTCYSTVLRRR